ncbi:MAG TPA: hypothetical protein VHL53_12940, partial [Acidimicrobiia bacterium]|nr:hypothetical protein [Acidimicrobiia bacterium]
MPLRRLGSATALARRALSGRPRQLPVLGLALIVLVAGVAAGYGRASRPSRVETAAAVTDEPFADLPLGPSPLAADPPT